MPQPPVLAAAPPAVMLSPSQMASLAKVGEERTADIGDVLYGIGDRSYPFIAILDGEVAILDSGGNEIVRHCASAFLGELNLLSGQTVFRHGRRDRAAALHRGRPRGAATASLRGRVAQRAGASPPLSRAAKRSSRSRVSASRSSARIRRTPTVQHARVRASNRLPFTWRDPRARQRSFGGSARRRHSTQPACRWCDCRVAPSFAARRSARCSRALGIGRELQPREEVDLLVVGAGPAGLGAAVYGASEGLDTLVIESTGTRRPGRHLAQNRELSRVPGGDHRHRADQPRRNPGAEVQRPSWRRRTARSRSSPGTTVTSCGSKTATRSPPAPF